MLWQLAILSLDVGSMTCLKALLAHLRPGERKGQESAAPTAPESISSLKMGTSIQSFPLVAQSHCVQTANRDYLF